MALSNRTTSDRTDRTDKTVEWIRRRSVLVFSLAIFGYLLIGSVKLIFENYRVNQESGRLQGELAQLEQRNLELQNLLAYYRTDSYKEKEARFRLNFQKPGERVVVVAAPPDEQVVSIAQPSTETRDPTPPSNVEQWKQYFFGKRS